MNTLWQGLALSWRMTRRDWRSGELRLLVLALVVAVAAVTSVGFFVDRLRSGLERDAAQLLGADLVLRGDQPIGSVQRLEAQRRGLSVSESAQFPSMALADGKSQLSALKAVAPGYPLRGRLRVTAAPLGPDAPATDIPPPGAAWVDASLLANLGLQLGDSLTLGDRSFRIDKLITVEPDRGISFVNLSPRVMIRMDDLMTTGLVQEGSRISYRLYVAGDAPAMTAYQAWLTSVLEPGQRVETLEEGRPQVRNTLDRAEQFLALVALLSAMLAAVAVALAARRFTMRHLDSCAVMRCLGMAQGGLLGLFIGEFVIIGVLGAVLGCAFGFAGHYVLVEMLSSLLTTRLPPPSFIPALQGFLTGFILLLGFALPPVVQLRRVPPLRVLRRDVGLPAPFTALGYGAALLAFAALLLWSARDLKIGAMTAGGFLGGFILFAVLTWLVLQLLGVVRRKVNLSASWRFALAAMQRRPAATIVQTVSLALGLMALLLLSVTRTDLIDAWRQATPPDAPNRFVINIQPEQREPFTGMLREARIGKYDLAPMVRGRLIETNGSAIGPQAYDDERAQRMVNREFNLSYMDELPGHNRVTSGRWFTGPGELSVEEGLAQTLGVKLGDELTFDIAGSSVKGRITSLRKVQWDSMRVNFFVIFPTAALADMPQTTIAALHVPVDNPDLSNRLVQTFPNLTVIDTGAIVKQVQAILDQVIAAVEFLFIFTLAAGLLVLYAALLSSRDERTRESGLLRALGASRSQLQRAQMVEFGALGILSGLMAAAGAVAIGWALATFAFNFPYRFTAMPWLWGVFGGVAIAMLGGWLGLRPVLNHPPLATLREA